MSSFADFENKSKELKQKIYDKYSKDLNSIKEVLIPAIISVYGEKYSELINKKIEQIRLVNFFTRQDLHSYFLSEHKFIPRVLDPEKTEDNIDSFDELFKSIEELNELTDTFYGFTKLPTESEKLFDKDVFEYLQICTEHDVPFGSIYYDEKNNEIIKDKLSHEYDIQTSMHSCLKKEITNLNILLDRYFLYDNISKSLGFNNVSLEHNVDKDFNKIDILLINPLKFNKNNVFLLIYFIIKSINTDLVSNENNRFIFDCGLLDTFEKHNFSKKEDLSTIYSEFTDFINERIALEVINYLQNHNLFIWNHAPLPKHRFLTENPCFADIFYYYKRLILDAIITKDNTLLFNTFGKENYKKYFETYLKLDKLYKRNDYNNKKTDELHELLQKIFRDMRNYKKSN